MIIYRLFNILLHLDCINGRAVNARVAVCAGIVLASKAHPTKPTAALDMYAAVYKADGRAYLYAVDLLAVNARVAVCTRAAVFDLREPTAALEMNAIINIAVFGIDFKSFHRLSKVARVVLAVFTCGSQWLPAYAEYVRSPVQVGFGLLGLDVGFDGVLAEPSFALTLAAISA